MSIQGDWSRVAAGQIDVTAGIGDDLFGPFLPLSAKSDSPLEIA